MSQVENKEVEEVKEVVEQEAVNTEVPTGEPVVASKGFFDEEDDDKDYNRILPRALVGGKGISVTLHKLPEVKEIKKKDGGTFMAVAWEFYEAVNDAYHKQNIALPIEDVDIVTEQDKSIQDTNKSTFKHLMGAFVDFSGVAAENWVDFANKVIAKFPKTAVGSKCEIKLVYSKDNKYIQFPRFPNYISTTRKKKTLETDPNNVYDKVEKTKLPTSGSMGTDDINTAQYNDLV